ncbi:hypothetical protein [Enterobacter sp. RIT418]|uniref:hypothetical protein n=1 Tax=Enterobacter sp. RIT418 TaxID=2202164 RepID=UPI0011BE271F|nr:hypothetical protein [Enterobacter sp. RIT 418]
MDIQTLEGYESWLDPENKFQLDKDIKIPGNKVYGEATCMFVSDTQNSIDANARRHNKKS